MRRRTISERYLPLCITGDKEHFSADWQEIHAPRLNDRIGRRRLPTPRRRGENVVWRTASVGAHPPARRRQTAHPPLVSQNS